jgi:hypothetical protein
MSAAGRLVLALLSRKAGRVLGLRHGNASEYARAFLRCVRSVPQTVSAGEMLEP